ncbi:LuxR C-terminal-related transcriptional regulator [Kitasatospora sp. NPDC004669]|uniref:helix-turn-helix transcriptional regulator n=1 Tax=Kitasatospora sp. NPDC004669 TaxID=3154555 RepID=UPI0033B4CAC9
MATTLPAPNLPERDIWLLVHIAAESQTRTIAADPALALVPSEVDAAVRALFTATGTRTVLQLVAWGAAHGIVTGTTALTTAVQLPRRHQQVLAGWVGGHTTPEIVADFGISTTTMRGYGRDLRSRLGVPNQVQASIAGVLGGLVLLNDIDPTWPAEPFARAIAPRGHAA